MLAAGTATVKTVAGVGVSWGEARGSGGERGVGEGLASQGPGVGGWGREGGQGVLFGAPTTGTLVQVEGRHVWRRERERERLYISKSSVKVTS